MEFLFEKIATSTFLRISYNPHVEKGTFKTISAMSKKIFCEKIISMPGQMNVMHHVSVCSCIDGISMVFISTKLLLFG